MGGAGESDLGQTVAWEELRGVRIVAGEWFAGAPGGGEEHEDSAAFVDRIGEDVDHVADHNVDTGFLRGLSSRGVAGILAGVEETAGQCPPTASWVHRAAYQQQLVVAEDGDANGDLRVGVVDVCAALTDPA
jgi:hypothetical protein